MNSYIPITDNDKKEMLREIGINEVEELFKDIPEEIKLNRNLKLPPKKSEMDTKRYFKDLSAKNASDFLCFRGAGAYNHFIPAAVKHVITRSEFYTAYTPYQPEISQGTLQTIFEYQTMICELTGMDASNASVYDGATAAAEAAFMCADITGRSKILVSSTVNPETRKVLDTYCKAHGLEIVKLNYRDGITDIEELKEKANNDTAGVIIQSPNFFGCIEPCKDMFEFVHNSGGISVMSVNPISMGILKTPGELGADIAVGDGQPLGNPLSFGGPYVGFMAVKEKFVRKLPGRIVGQTVDLEGKRGFVLTLQAREQHIRREKASSNICSNQALNALAVGVYLSSIGKKGLKQIAEICAQKARYMAEKISKLKGFSVVFSKSYFHEFVIKSEKPVNEINKILADKGIIGGYELEKDYPELKNCVLYCVTEMNSKEDIEKLVDSLKLTVDSKTTSLF
ncbi:MAG: aminomethyl-transferring glycine dehydrogenase subunit GcvPA [Ignavibacteriales bacterium]